jgi:hypothetical protein
MPPLKKNGSQNTRLRFARRKLQQFDYIPVIYRDNIPTQNSTGGIFKKITVHDLGAQTLNLYFLETRLTGQTDFTVFSNQQWLTKQQSISFPRQSIQGQSYMRKCVQWVCTGTKREPNAWRYNRATVPGRYKYGHLALMSPARLGPDTALARTSSNCKRHTHPLVREEVT